MVVGTMHPPHPEWGSGTRRLHGKVLNFTGAGRRLVTKERARGENLLGSAQGACRGSVVLCVFRRVPLARHVGQRVSRFVRSSSLFYLRGRVPPRVATRLRRCLGFAWLIMNLFFVFIETFGSWDSQLDCFTALRGTDSFPPSLRRAVLRACCAFTLSWFGGLQDILVSSLPYLVYSSYSFFSPFFGSSPLPFRLSQDSSFLYQ
ncbi:hypothetical protein PAPYR_13079 [Paratrimastix pyriformis]|uniref:Transmembrane protein n=1 Tax=Paratrimastix pyriformis TaxID=342808 RepID=A0ABQ8U4E3_9EUKA|nr:hypothetical protein PAPYR_13079 [Paratrimastix pyriformis]